MSFEDTRSSTSNTTTDPEGNENPVQIELSEGPEDSITALKFVPNSVRHLIASSLDGTIRVYDFHVNSVNFIHRSSLPIFGCTVTKPFHAYFGGLDCSVSGIDFTTGAVTKLGTHDKPVRCIEHSDYPETIIISGCWDSTMKFWDPRTNGQIGCYVQPGQIFFVSALDEIVAVATAKNIVVVWDIRNMNQPLLETLSEMPHYRSRCLGVSFDGRRLALGSVEGRVAVQHIESTEHDQNYVFRAHSTKFLDKPPLYHPVNAISCHPQSYFATGGSDGLVKIWDPILKACKITYSTYPIGVAALNFSENGQLLAIGCCYPPEEIVPIDSIPQSRIFVRCSKNVEDEKSNASIFSIFQQGDSPPEAFNYTIPIFTDDLES